MRSLKVALGVILITVGFLALVTPLTPGAWLLFVGLELVGIRLAAADKIKDWFRKRRGVHTSDTPESDTESK
jgi:uncharacterized protein YqgC (DUF456 family)